MKILTHTLSWGLALSLLTGCGTSNFLKSTEPPPTIYTLQAAAPAAPQAAPSRVLEVARPALPPGFDTDRIALYLADGQKLDYYAAAKWADMLDEVMQEFTRRSATNTLSYVIAVTPAQSVGSDYRLQIKVNDFQPVYRHATDSAPRVLVSLEFTLISQPRDRIVSNFIVTREAQIDENRLDRVAAVLEKLLQDAHHEAFTILDIDLRRAPSK